jgi:hypothetical protein
MTKYSSFLDRQLHRASLSNSDMRSQFQAEYQDDAQKDCREGKVIWLATGDG